MPIVEDLNDLVLQEHVAFMTILEQASNPGQLPVGYDTYLVNTIAEDSPTMEQFIAEIKGVTTGLDVNVCGVMMLTSDAPIHLDPIGDTPIAHAISLSLLAPETWQASIFVEDLVDCVFNLSEVEIPKGETAVYDDIRSALEEATPEGMVVYGPMVIYSDAPITFYKGSLDGQIEDFDVIGRRMLATIVIEATRSRSISPLANALDDYINGKCDECPKREVCEAYIKVSTMFPKDNPEAMAMAQVMLGLAAGGVVGEDGPMIIDPADLMDAMAEGGPADERPDHDNDDEV